MSSIPRRWARAAVVACLLVPTAAESATLRLTAVNRIGRPRANETLELSAQDLAPLGEADLRKVHVFDASGKEMVCQSLDLDGDGRDDQLIFQTTFSPNETQTFELVAGKPRIYAASDFRAYGRFNRERFDDFAWENDRIAHRVYGKALETAPRDPLTSSGVDVWLKRTGRLVLNDWYMLDDYHVDHGEGADFYTAGRSRGVGGSGLWARDRLWVSGNFARSRVLAQGPLRVLFELEYEPFDVDGTRVREIKRVRLDAGQHFSRFESRYTAASPSTLVAAPGLGKMDVLFKEASAGGGWLVAWQPVRGGAAGGMGSALVIDPKRYRQIAEDDHNLLLLAPVADDGTVVYWAGAGWDRSGLFPSYGLWHTYVRRFAQALQSPIEVTVSAR